MCHCRVWVWGSADLASGHKAGGSRGGGGEEHLRCVLLGMLTNEKGPSVGGVGVGTKQGVGVGEGLRAKPRCAARLSRETP